MKANKLLGIQALRGIAACMVVFFHAMQLHNPKNMFGASGVDIFFVISGFVMAISGSKSPSAIKFIWHRIIRVVPLYWVMTCLALVKLSFGTGRTARVQITPAFVLTSLSFIPYRDSLGDILPILPPGWTLNYEMFFYLLFALALALNASVPKLLTLLILTLVGIGFFYPATLLDPLLLEFLAGLLLGYAVQYGYKMPTSWAYASVVIGAACLLLHGPRVATWGLSGFLIVQSAVMLEGKFRIPGLLTKIGDASYSLYLSHYLFIAPLSRACIRFVPAYVTVAICLTASIAASFVVFRFIETPITHTLKRINGSLPSLAWIPPQAIHWLPSSGRRH